MNSRKNLIINTKLVTYNTNIVFGDLKNRNVKIPCYVIADVIRDNKTILITHNNKKIASYSANQLKKNLSHVDWKLYNGWFQHKQINYNLTVVKINDSKNSK